MKRFTALLFAILLVLQLCACGEQGVTETSASSEALIQTTAAQAETTAAEGPVAPVSDDPQVAYGYNGVVSSADPVASEVGLNILKQGGNAMDAAIATAFALGLTENAASGIGGSGLMMYYDASTGETTAINYYFECPAGMVSGDFSNSTELRDNGLGGLRAVVPGFVAGMEKANELFGTMTLAELIQPTVDLAENGVTVTEFMAETYRDYFERIQLYPETARVFTNEGFPYGEGDTFTNPDLAKTLRIIQEKGAAGFYTGEVAEAIVESQRATGSKMTLEDLANYTVDVTTTISTTYRGYKIVCMPPVSGGAVVLSTLNLAEHFDISSMEFGSTEYLHTWGEVMRLGVSDYTTYFEDPTMYDIMDTIEGMISKDYADDRIKLFSADSTMELGPVGQPDAYSADSHTTHLSVIDKDGNMVTMTNTHGDFFGTLTTVTDYGFVLENTGTFTAGSSYQPEAGKKGRSPMSPTFVFDADGNPVAAIGTPGSNRIMSTIPLIISNLIDYGMDLKEALDSPRLSQARNGNLTLEGGFDESVVAELEALGHEVTVRVANDSYFGGAHCVYCDPETGLKTGAADSRRSGAAAAY